VFKRSKSYVHVKFKFYLIAHNTYKRARDCESQRTGCWSLKEVIFTII